MNLDQLSTLKVELSPQQHYLTVTLNRPAVHNAMDLAMMEELTAVFEALSDKAKGEAAGFGQVRFALLKAEGVSFSAGADLNWMRKIKDFSLDENIEDSKILGKMLQTINDCPLPVVASVHGACLGGAMGLISVCDFVLATEETVFGFPEVRLGLLPALISPYVVSKMGLSNSRALFLTGRRFKGDEALRLHLVHQLVSDQENQLKAEEVLVDQLLKGGPKAQIKAKEMIKRLGFLWQEGAVFDTKMPFLDYTAELISKCRRSEEGQEGVQSVLNRKKPSWVEDQQ